MGCAFMTWTSFDIYSTFIRHSFDIDSTFIRHKFDIKPSYSDSLSSLNSSFTRHTLILSSLQTLQFSRELETLVRPNSQKVRHKPFNSLEN